MRRRAVPPPRRAAAAIEGPIGRDRRTSGAGHAGAHPAAAGSLPRHRTRGAPHVVAAHLGGDLDLQLPPR
jgi:hypothetical protein